MKLMLIAKNNIKKKKSDSIVLFLLVTLAVLLLYVSISVLTNMETVLDKKNIEMNGADFTLITQSTFPEDIRSALENREEVEKVEVLPSLYLGGTQYYQSKETKNKEDQMDFILEDMAIQRSISTLSIVEEGDVKKENAIVLPYYFKVGLGYKVGDSIILKYNNQEYKFEVYGFSEDIMFSTPNNISIYKCYVTEFSMEKIIKENAELKKGNTFQVSLKDGYKASEFDDSIVTLLNDTIEDFPYLNNWGLNYENMKYGTTITANILMAIVAIFAILLIGIGMVVIRFSIQNAIDGNLKNIGMLQAIGYTSRQLIEATVMEFSSITIAGTVLGLLMATGASNIIGTIVSSSIGLQWGLGFDIKGAVISVGMVFVLIIITVLLTASRYREITPLNALREGIFTHNFRKNHIPLEQSILPLNTALGIKNIWNHKKKNAAIGFIAILLSLACNIGFSLYENFAESSEQLLQLVGLEMPTTMISMDNQAKTSLEEVRETLEQREEVEQMLFVTMNNLVFRYGDKQVTSLCDIYDDTSKLQTDTLVEGRRPQYDNEVLLSNPLCNRLGVSLGDVVYIETNDKSEAYIIVGISQHINNLGKKGMLTFDGVKRLNQKMKPSYIYAYISEEVTFQEIEKDYKTLFPEISMINMQALAETSLKSISSGMTTICILFIVCTIIVVSLVIFLLVKTKLVREKKMMGIYKALGFTTKQLMLQTAMSYIPIITAGAIIGAVTAYFVMEPATVAALSFCGIRSCKLYVNITHVFATVIGMTIVASVIAVLCSIKIRKIEPYQMLQE